MFPALPLCQLDCDRVLFRSSFPSLGRYVWKKDEELVSQTRGGRITLQEGSLHISQTWSGDIGDYTCDVISQAGNDSKAARLEVM